MGNRGRPAKDGTSTGKPFNQMSPAEKAREFDMSYRNPHAYAINFGVETPSEVSPERGKHRKKK